MIRPLRAIALILGAVFFFDVQPRILAESGTNQWIVVAPQAFTGDLKPLIEHRESEGFHTVIVDSSNVIADGGSVLARVKAVIGQFNGRSYVLLAGVSSSVPMLTGSVARMKGEGTDVGYGIPDANGAPTVAVGRFPARDEDELRAMVKKTLRFEESGHGAAWRNRLLLLVGNPYGGVLADMYVQGTLDTDLAALDPSWSVRTLFNASSSRFFFPPYYATQAATFALTQGEVFSIYLGHSDARGMDFLGRDRFEKLEIPEGNGTFFTCGCFALQTDSKTPNGKNLDGYGLYAMRNVSGPVAVIGATGATYSAAGQLAAEGLLTRLGKAPFSERLGDYWLGVSAGIARGKIGAATYAILDSADGSNGKESLEIMRREHLEMWMLLGDPALRIPTAPQDITLDWTGTANGGKTLTVNGTLPKRLEGGKVQISIGRPLNSQPSDLANVPKMTAQNVDLVRGIIVTNNIRANTYELSSVDAEAKGDRFSAMLKLPEKLPWSDVIVRASATLSNEMGIGVRVVKVGAAH